MYIIVYIQNSKCKYIYIYKYQCIRLYILLIYVASHPDQPATINPPVDPNLQECTVWDPPGQLEWSLQGQTRPWPWNQVGHGKMMSCTKYPRSPSWINLESRLTVQKMQSMTRRVQCATVQFRPLVLSPSTPVVNLGCGKKIATFGGIKYRAAC